VSVAAEAAGRRRPRLAIALVVLTTLLLAGSAVSWYAHGVLVDDEEFSGRAAAALENSDVRLVLADRVVGALTRRAVPNAIAVRPLVVPLLATLADSSQFRRVFARAVGARHRALIEGETTFSIELPIGEGLFYEGLQRVAPRVARRIPAGLRVPIVRLDPHGFELATARVVVDIAGWRWPLLIAALLAAAASALVAGGIRSALVALGMAVTGAGLIVAALVAGLGEFVVSHAAHAVDLADERERDAVRELWSVLFSDLRTAGLIAALGGAVVAALAARGLPSLDLHAWGRRARAAAGSPSLAARLARAAVLIALGAGLVLAPGLLGRVLVVAGGVLLVLLGVSQLPGGAGEPAAGAARKPATRPAGVASWLLAASVAAAVVTSAVVIALVLPGPSTSFKIASPVGACNGKRALCSRRLDQVVFPATHNSYAAADEPGWFFANQRRGIARQLRDGIRAFLIDIHYGVADPKSGRVRTDLEAEGGSRNKVARELSPEALRTADRLAGRVGAGDLEGERTPYLCHTLCELGAEPVGEQFELFRRFLADNPREVVILFVEPYVPVEEIERGLDEAGLLEQAAEIDPEAPLPTLRQLARAGTRLVVLAEQDGGTRPWYLPGFELAQDTPLGARAPGELSCGRYRGNADSPLLLVNHWIDTFPPSPARNERIGGEFLERRLERCELRRLRRPNLVAVDFYERSDVLGIADRLNGRRP
jgi:hypothetical protein